MPKILTGNEAAATAMRQINPDVVAAYPITPSTQIPEIFSEFVQKQKVQTEFVPVESEHSALSACLAASATGARAMTATASQGLALMHEVLWNTAGLRLPVVLLNANRALSAPLSIHGDHSDVLAQRDTGWIQLFASSPQEVYDLTLQAFPIAESVRLPVMICFDGFETSHLATNVEILPDNVVTKFLGQPPKRTNLLDFQKNPTLGSYTSPDFYFEARISAYQALIQAKKVITQIGQKFQKISQRNYSTHSVEYSINSKNSKTDILVFVLGSAYGAIKETLPNLATKKIKVKLIRLRTFRPFPGENLLKIYTQTKPKKVAVFDRVVPNGAPGGPLFCELAGSGIPTPNLFNFIYGVGQRQMNPDHVTNILTKLHQNKCPKINFVNLNC